LIPCSGGILEGRLRYREKNNGKPGVILCPPHPLLAGNMDNNVITSLADTLSNYFPVLSFNYRGVGRSFKAEPDLPLFEYWNKLDECGDFSSVITDTKQVIEWSKRLFAKCHLLGYSFGSYIALSALSLSTLSLTAITPPLAEHDFEGLNKLTCASLFVFAEKDSLLSVGERCLNSAIETEEIADCDHFFVGREEDVTKIVEVFLLNNV
jgi:alpha/beta superfamily hydrolase